MGLFESPEEKQRKQAEKEEKLLAKYGLTGLTGEDLASVKTIANELMGTGLMEAGTALTFSTKTEDRLQICYQRALVEQNWIIIRKLCEISDKLK